MLVVKGIEVWAFTLVGELRWVANHISICVVPSVVVVSVNTLLSVNSMDENIALGVVLKLRETFDVIWIVVETGWENEGFVGILFTVGEAELVLLGNKLRDLGKGIHAGPGLNLSGDSTTL